MASVSKQDSILHVRLPCWKIFPAGSVYLADYLKKQGYEDQRIFDLALISPGRRYRELQRVISTYSPDVIAFSWRNIQTFGPHDASPALETVLKYDHSGRLGDKIQSIGHASRMIVDHIQQISSNIRFIKAAHNAKSKPRVVVGGSAFSEFPEILISRMPAGVIGVVGEGEKALAAIVAGDDLSNHNVVFRDGDKVRRFQAENCLDLASVGPVDYRYIARIFPEFREYTSGFIGVQTKRGCPFACTFCVYNRLEGSKIRFRDPETVAIEVEQLNREFGVNKIWFTDSQFCSTKETIDRGEELLDHLLFRRLSIGWTGYIRVENMTESFARKALASGILSFELSFTGSQKMIDALRLGYRLSTQMNKFRMIRRLGYRGQQIKLYLPLNAPGETRETLLETLDTCKNLYDIFGEQNVVPWIFFLAVQPGTELETQLIGSGYLKPDYNPLSYNPFDIKRLLYNPPPFGPMIAKSYLQAKRSSPNGEVGRDTLRHLQQRLSAAGPN